MQKVILISLLAGVGGVLFAEGSRTPADGSARDALLGEVRALRAEITQVTSAGIRTQLLVARLQLQEQRVITAARQLAETQNALTAVQTQIVGERARVRQLDEAAARAGQGRATFQQAILEAGTQIEQLQKEEFQLQTREKELQRAVMDEQTRWTDFNDRLDALERSLPASVSH